MSNERRKKNTEELAHKRAHTHTDQTIQQDISRNSENVHIDKIYIISAAASCITTDSKFLWGKKNKSWNGWAEDKSTK